MSNNNIKTMSNEEQNSKINEFIDAFQAGMSAWKRAGEILVELVESDPHVYDYISLRCPAMTAGMLQTLERVGRGMMLPTLAMDSSPGGVKLKGLPLSVQTRYETEPVPLIVETGDGADVLLVKVRDMTRDQARQVFGNGRLRTEGEQRAWIIDAKSKAAKPSGVSAAEWSIHGGKLNVKGVIFSKEQLASIYMQM